MSRHLPRRPGRRRHRCRRRPGPGRGAGAGRGRCAGRAQRPAGRGRRGRRGDPSAGGAASVVPGRRGGAVDRRRARGRAVDGPRRLDIVVNNAGMHPRPDAVQPGRRGVGPGAEGAPARPLPAVAQRRVVLAGAVEGDRGAGLRPGGEHRLRGVPHRVARARPNYAAAKGGITALTLSTARGLGRVGVRANAICPRARTAMTADVFGDDESGQAVDPLLARPRRAAGRLPRLTGRRADHRPGLRGVRRHGRRCSPRRSWSSGSTPAATLWDLADLDKQVGGYFADRDPASGFAADAVMKLTV